MTPKIVFLDRDTTDANDVDLGGLESQGEVIYHGITGPGDTAQRITDAQIVITNKVVIGPEEMDSAANLELIQIAATGVNNVDLDAAKQRGIKVCNVNGYSTPGVAQHVFASLLNLVSNVHRFAAEPEAWPKSPIFTRLDFPITELAGKTMGIVGLGSIGSEVAKIAEAFGMKVVAYAREGAVASGEIERLEHEAFFRTADVISLHCPLTDQNEEFINAETLGLMKPSSILINTGRGPLVNEADLAEAIRSGAIAGAALDVVSVEPPPADNPLILAAEECPQLFITPHTAWSSLESRQRLVDGMVENLSVFLQGGTPANLVV